MLAFAEKGENVLHKSPLVLLLIIMISFGATAQGFILGDETKGATIRFGKNTSLTARFLIQPRLDLGNLTKSRDGKSYETESDLLLTTTCLEFDGYLIENLRYAVHLSADNWGKAGHEDEIELYVAYVDYKLFDALSIRARKAKLPYSRISMTSSSKQLLAQLSA